MRRTLTPPSKEQFVLAYRLLNTLSAKSFEKGLADFWVGAVAQGARGNNVFTIQAKSKETLLGKLSRFRRIENCEYAVLYEYLDKLAEHCKISLRKRDKNGVIKEFSLPEYQMFATFVYDVSIHFRPTGSLQSLQFNCHELLWGIADILMVKDTLENGSGMHAYDQAMEMLLCSKPSSFFKDGYIADFFIHDRVAMSDKKAGVRFICTNKKYLSTMTLTDEQKRQSILGDEWEILKVA